MRTNYSGEKRRKELAAKQKREEKAKKQAERKALKASGLSPDEVEDDQESPETDEAPTT